MRPARILLLIVALVAGGLAAFLATRGGDPSPAVADRPVEMREEPRVQVLIANNPIGLGQRLGPDDVSWQDWPEGAIRPEYITAASVPDAIQQITGSVARFEIFTGEPIREAKLVTAEQGYMSAVITEGMRAVSVGVTAESASGGFIVPNDRVDVVLTRSGTGDTGVSETILGNVRVLAIGNRLGETGTTGGGEEGEDDPRSQVFEANQIATLELSPTQSETILNAAASGRLALVLRSVVDFNETYTASAGRSQSVRLIRYGAEASVMAGSAPLGDPALTGAAAVPVAETTPLDAANPLPTVTSPIVGAPVVPAAPASEVVLR